MLETTVDLDDNGISAALEFVIPEATRSVTVVATGDSDELYALASLEIAGTELVDIDLNAYHGTTMNERYFTEQTGQMPGNLFQVIRLGTATHVYPYAPGQAATPGKATLRVASTARNGTVDVTILLPEETDASTLHVNLVSVSDGTPSPLPSDFLPQWQSIFDQAGIEIVMDETVAVDDAAFARITDFSEPQEAPTSQSAQLAVTGRELAMSDALTVYVVDALPTGVGGLSLGVPGPPLPGSYYYGVLVRNSSNASLLARVTAHEVSHFLALQHVTNRGVSGTDYPDPISDTEPGSGNLMEDGTTLTEGQVFALRRSALLTDP